jgi:hypothetical protein
MQLTDQWQTVLNNQIGTIFYENFNTASVRVDGGDAITLPRDGFNFQNAVTVEVKNYNSSVAEIGVIK